jgi:F-type H+-transporting ATPase subunit epsilon
MAESFQLEVATPERLIVKEQVTEAQIPAREGYLGVLPGHAPLIAELKAGVLSYVVGGQTRTLAIHGGFVEVQPESVRVLADLAERAEEIDVTRAQTALNRAQKAIEQFHPDLDPAIALEDMMRAEARIEAAKKKPA